MWDEKNFAEISCSLVSLILLENNLELSGENFEKILQATNIKIEIFWYSWFFTKITKVGGDKNIAPANLKSDENPTSDDKIKPDEEKEDKSEKKEESDEDMGFGLFD